MADDSSNTRKDVSFTPSLTRIIQPTADMLGIKLKEHVEEKIDAAIESRKAKNVSDHIASARSKLDASQSQSLDEPGVEQLTLFSDWVEHSANIDPRDKEISDMWQNLLLEMTGQKPNTSLLLNKLKELSPEDAQVLIKLSHHDTSRNLSEEDIYRLKKLESLELIEPNSLKIQLLQISLFSSLALALFVTYQFVSVPDLLNHIEFNKNLPSNIFKFFSIWLIPLASVLLGWLVTLWYLRKKGILQKFTKKLTWIGRRIVLIEK
jgi:Arc/MetJ-type ribon-helix-helix transcriptional regulator